MEEEVERQYKSQTGVTGMMAGAVYDGQLVWSKGYGATSPDDKTPPDLDSVVRVASNTKIFTTLMLYQLRDAGIINIDTPLAADQPMFSIRNPYGKLPAPYQDLPPVTWKMLTNHLAGMPGSPPACDIGNCSISHVEMLKLVSELALERPPYVAPVYSNLGFAMLGRAMSNLTGEVWEDAVSERITVPLGLESTFACYETLTDDAKSRIARSSVDTDLLYATIGWMNPAGSMFSTTRDMLALATSLLAEQPELPGLARRSRDEMLSPSFVFESGREAQAQPFEVTYRNGAWFYTKSGDLNGWQSNLYMHPKQRLAAYVVVMTELDFSSLHGNISGTIVNELMNVVDVLNAEAEAKIPVEPPLDPALAVGSYFSESAGFGVELTTNDAGELSLVMGGATVGQLAQVIDEETGVPIPDLCRLRATYDPSKSCYLSHMDGFNGGLTYLDLDDTGKVIGFTCSILLAAPFHRV